MLRLYPVYVTIATIRNAIQPWISTNPNIDEVYDKIFVGDIATAHNPAYLKSIGVTHVIAAAAGTGGDYDFEYMRLPLVDKSTEDIMQYFENCNKFIDSAISSGGKVFVHCMCGVSRSVTIVAAYLISKGYTSTEAINIIKSRRSIANPNVGFLEQLKNYYTIKVNNICPSVA